MKVERIGDWILEDRLAAGGLPLVVMFVVSGDLNRDMPSKEFARLAYAYPEASFLVIDLLENPSLAEGSSVFKVPTTLILVDGHEASRPVA